MEVLFFLAAYLATIGAVFGLLYPATMAVVWLAWFKRKQPFRVFMAGI